MADRFVYLHSDLVGVEDNGRHPRRTNRRADESNSFSGNSRRRRVELESLDDLPAALLARAHKRTRKAAHLEHALRGSGAVDPATAFH